MELADIKKQFFAYRNGVAAEALRRSGMPYRMIFGLDLPTLTNLARQIGYNHALARRLWNEKDVRESRLLAIYLYDPDTLQIDESIQLCLEVGNKEEADIMAFRLLRRLPYAAQLLGRLKERYQDNIVIMPLEKNLQRH